MCRSMSQIVRLSIGSPAGAFWCLPLVREPPKRNNAPAAALRAARLTVIGYAKQRRAMPALIQIRAELDLSTRRLRHIRNEMNREPPLAGARLQIEQMKRDFKTAIHRDEVGPCNTFNCHGLTFGSRRTWIHRPADVQKILDDDDYIEIDKTKVKPGDIAIFRKNGEIDHSGIVVQVVERI